MQTYLIQSKPEAFSPFDRDFLRRPREPGIGRLGKIPTIENHESLVSLVGISPRIRLKCALPWARETVAGMLVEAAERLPSGLYMVVGTALRSLRMQTRSYWRYFKSVQKEHPEWPPNILRREVNRFFHPPDFKAPPGHCTGGAVDVGIATINGRMLDMTSSTLPKAKTWMTFDRRLTPKALMNRALLYNAMIEAGFTNCYDEWWHFSYGDTGWADRSGNPFALYGIPESFPPELAELIRQADKKSPRKPHR